jgi:hypothetical protein
MTVANGSQLISSREAKKGHAQALPGVGVGMVRVVAGETLGQRFTEPNTGDMSTAELSFHIKGPSKQGNQLRPFDM